MEKNYTEEIEKYLLGRLDENAVSELETRLKTDPDLAAELEFQREILQGFELFGDEKLRAKISKIDQKLAEDGFFQNENPAKTEDVPSGISAQRVFRWAAAASILLILVAGIWWFLKNQNTPSGEEIEISKEKTSRLRRDEKTENLIPENPKTPEKPAIENPKPAKKSTQPIAQTTNPAITKYRNLSISNWQSPDFSNVRAAENDSKSVIARAVEAFQKNDFPTVLNLLRPVLPTDKIYWQSVEILAHSYFQKGDLKKATARFREISESGKLPFSERADWFLLLCYLQNFPAGEADFEKLRTKILADAGHPYFEKAEKLRLEMGN